MTEVAVPPNHKIAAVRHYEAGPPPGLELVEPGETYATTKEEEWVSKKTTEVTNTKQVKTRVKRQVVLQDGKIVEDTGPMVETNTTEDTEKQEHHQTELRRVDDDKDKIRAIEGGIETTDLVPVPNPDGVVRDVKEKRVISRKEYEETKETEDVQHYGNITDEEFLKAVNSPGSDLRKIVLRDHEKALVSTGPRLINESHKSRQVTDTEETRELSSVRPDGRIVTETQRTTEHEEVNDDELPEDSPDINEHKESHERYFKGREQEDVEYLKNGVRVGHEMRYRTENTEAERYGNGLDEPDYDSLQARTRRRQNQRIPAYKTRGLGGAALPSASPLDRKDALTRKPLDFDQEEETRKLETSKWLENHFGSDSRSSHESLDDDDDDDFNPQAEPMPPRTNYFNVTIKSQPSLQTNSVGKINGLSNGIPKRSVSPPKVNRIIEEQRNNCTSTNGYYKGIEEWSNRNNGYSRERIIYPPSRDSPSPIRESRPITSTYRDHYGRPSPPRDYSSSPAREYRRQSPPREYHSSPVRNYRSPSPIREYRDYRSPSPKPYKATSAAPNYRSTTPTPPQRKKTSADRIYRSDKYERYRSASREDLTEEQPLEEPPPDYPPTSPPRESSPGKKHQKTRFATEPIREKNREKGGNIIGQSIRKLVGKIRSASAERKAKQQQRAAQKQRSPSPSYQKGHIIDTNITDSPSMNRRREKDDSGRRGGSPVHRYYLGEDPFGGSIYGRENKYDGVKGSSRSPRKFQQHHGNGENENDYRSHSTLGRLSKSTSRLDPARRDERVSQTLPRHSSRHEQSSRLDKHDKTDSTINVSIINTVSNPPHQQNTGKYISNGTPPAKPARTFLSRSKSFNVDLDGPTRNNMYQSNPHLNRINESPLGLKSPGLITSISRSQRDLTSEPIDERLERNNRNNFSTLNGTNRFSRNGYSDSSPDYKQKTFLKDLRQRAPDLYRTLHENDELSVQKSSSRGYTSTAPSKPYYGDIYEPPTRLRDTTNNVTTTIEKSYTPNSRTVITRRGSNSSTDFSETYHTTTENNDKNKSTVTDTVESFSRKTLPARGGKGLETIQSTEKKMVTKSTSRYQPPPPPQPIRYETYERKGFYESSGRSGPVVIEVRNNGYRK